MTEEMNWNEELEMDDISMGRFEALVDEYFDIRDSVQEAEKTVKGHKADLAEVETKLIAYMEKYEKISHDGRKGKIELRTEKYPAVPKDEESREKLFSYLRKEGIFDQMITINHNTLRGWYKEEVARHETDPLFKVPGLEELFERKKIQKGRGKRK